jgi:phage repressor protein C with HTH and peptisase S24 domain
VVIEREQQPGIFYVKRIKEISDAGVYVMSDNSAGTDSRTWGYLQKEEVIARVIARIRKSK